MHTLYSKILFAGIGLLFAITSYGQDTLNQFDENNYRHGYWLIKTDNTPAKNREDQLFLEGRYFHGLKTNIWLTYFNNNLIKKEKYNSNHLEHDIQYNSNGNVIEECYFDQDGKLIQGQKYQYRIINGKNTLVYHGNLGSNYKLLNGEYYDSTYECWFTFKDSLGKYYSTPSNDCDTVKLKRAKSPTLCDPTNLPIPANDQSSVPKLHDPYIGKDSKQISEDGEYRNGKLWNGKKYVYDKNGMLQRIEIYKEGKYAGDAQMD